MGHDLKMNCLFVGAIVCAKVSRSSTLELADNGLTTFALAIVGGTRVRIKDGWMDGRWIDRPGKYPRVSEERMEGKRSRI